MGQVQAYKRAVDAQRLRYCLCPCRLSSFHVFSLVIYSLGALDATQWISGL